MARFAGRGAVHRRSLSISHWGSKFQLEIPLQLRLPLNGKQARLEDKILVCHRRERREIAVQADLASLGQRHFLFSRLPRSLVFFLEHFLTPHCRYRPLGAVTATSRRPHSQGLLPGASGPQGPRHELVQNQTHQRLVALAQRGP
jgi:hypothetical protein